MWIHLKAYLLQQSDIHVQTSSHENNFNAFIKTIQNQKKVYTRSAKHHTFMKEYNKKTEVMLPGRAILVELALIDKEV